MIGGMSFFHHKGASPYEGGGGGGGKDKGIQNWGIIQVKTIIL